MSPSNSADRKKKLACYRAKQRLGLQTTGLPCHPLRYWSLKEKVLEVANLISEPLGTLTCDQQGAVVHACVVNMVAAGRLSHAQPTLGERAWDAGSQRGHSGARSGEGVVGGEGSANTLSTRDGSQSPLLPKAVAVKRAGMERLERAGIDQCNRNKAVASFPFLWHCTKRNKKKSPPLSYTQPLT
ncbi:hypothetical protein KIL84_000352 [Mauremys mutica]|uniref:Uncharacterized protein n=1 Tax=Mauremys mutica TaxID=74926 RepID=A0A9D3XG40_9SAUR|nr:hypothetical protein KIL84_000352 [Mauremys mutica]